MTARNDLDRQLTSFLRDGPEELPYESFDAVRDRTEQTQQRVVIGPWRFPEMNKIVTIGLGAAAVVVALFVGVQLLGSPGGGLGAGPIASVTLEPTPEPTVEASLEPTPEGLLPEGPHALLEGPVAMDVTISAAGWSGDSTGGGVLLKNDAEPPDGAGLIVFAGVDEYYVYGDPCRWSTTRPDTPATTVDEFVAGLSAQASRDAAEPVDITLDGYAGKSITLHVPDDAVFEECDLGFFASWGGAGLTEHDLGRYHQGPGQIDNVWILDVDGQLVVIDWSHYEGTPQNVVDELRAIVESATFNE